MTKLVLHHPLRCGKTNYNYFVAPGVSQGLEHEHELRNLRRTEGSLGPAYYFKYDRVAYGVFQPVIIFLGEYGFLSH